ncbi:TRAP transporter substrate-binding protein DctP [Eoetvoesiella caeni]|uniref:TRAP-type C4-dicarboxylate transport system substrate-binding protein n=1 Tax=Eoetvoesiella caeni TaxID=645616 RepID=A0A366HAH8_9BURK|nr:TRAP transporter substrate-binding protein DctP [Eoetvoesiella caeni]MCI2809687.1 TRAP transporter substrate-binding protein DctP [Eoetvoesiella caeni]NYT56396.1 TRAP transporter substrate-binding protein DctP [Eoetvoesiella caeni]RBP38454.1 TRAP-type C4-dicarboxylate transport system substrate-binding protein [Eoetvoesiella caeni]
MKLTFKKLALGTLLGLVAFSAQSAQVTLKAVSAFAKNSYFDQRFENFVKKFNEEGKGILQIQMLGGPESMPPFEVGNALRAGVIDLANTTGVFLANLLPEALALSFSTTPMATLRANGGDALLDNIMREKANIVWLGRVHDGLKFHIYTNKKPENFSFKDMKLRSVPVYRSFFQSLGALPLQVPPGEVYTALERGVVDGYGWPSVGIFDLGWQEKTKYRIEPGFYNVEDSLYMNQDKYKKLDETQRAFLTAQVRQLEELFVQDQKAVEREKTRLVEAGIEIISLPPDLAAKFIATANEAGWKAIDQASPKYAAQLRKAFGAQ